MDFVFWIIVIVLIVGIVWWLLNRNKTSKAGGTVQPRAEGGLSGGSAAASAAAAGTAGIPSAAGFGTPSEPAAPTTADETREPARPAEHRAAAAGPEDVHEPAAVQESPDVDRHSERAEPVAAEPAPRVEPLSTGPDASDQGEWETKWSEADGSGHTATHRPAASEATGAGAVPLAEAPPGAGASYVHHPEYTEPHSPTLPGAETAAAEAADDAGQAEPDGPGARVAPGGARAAAEAPAASSGSGLPDSAPETETADSARSSAAVETAASHVAGPSVAAAGHDAAAEPTGHLAADQPYGAGSASPGPDGSGPADFDVKGDAGAMVYYEEGHADYEQIRADVWFESPAHAEAAGFRAPRRMRL